MGRCDGVPGPVLLLHPRGLGELQGCHSLTGRRREGQRERERKREKEREREKDRDTELNRMISLTKGPRTERTLREMPTMPIRTLPKVDISTDVTNYTPTRPAALN